MPVGDKGDGSGKGVAVKAAVGIAVRVSVPTVLTMGMAISVIAVGLVAGVDLKPLQDASVAATRNKGINAFSTIFTFRLPSMFCKEMPNGLRPRQRSHRGSASALFWGTSTGLSHVFIPARVRCAIDCSAIRGEFLGDSRQVAFFRSRDCQAWSEGKLVAQILDCPYRQGLHLG